MAKTEAKNTNAASDLMWLVLAVAIVAAGIVGFYYVEDQFITPIRVAGLLVAVVAGLFVFGQSSQGRNLFRFMREADVERRKVVWPSRQETIQTTIMVLVVTIIVALMLWGIDTILRWLLRVLLGQGA